MEEIGQPYLWRCDSLDIVYTSPPVMTVEEDIEDDSLRFLHGFGFGIYITGNGCNSKKII